MKHRNLYDILDQAGYVAFKVRDAIKSKDRTLSLELFVMERHLITKAGKYMRKNRIEAQDNWYNVYLFQLAQYRYAREEYFKTIGGKLRW